jgi:hypothetical protein
MAVGSSLGDKFWAATNTGWQFDRCFREYGASNECIAVVSVLSILGAAVLGVIIIACWFCCRTPRRARREEQIQLEAV